ncbi:MAG: hypothetical protein GKR93_01680 [Gammaproteobacteria bacterium]|nr:hypothetical protein [Gammaproteobacteria bacterium]
MSYEFTLVTELPGSPKQIYDSWLSSEGHTAMTGGVAHVTDQVGDSYDAWDGYITGENLELDANTRIVQSWRTSHFESGHSDSIIELTLEKVEDRTRLKLRHSNVPDGQTNYEESGWTDHYFTPMKRRFEWLQMNLANSD